MDGKLFADLYHVVMNLDHPNSKASGHSDRTIVLVKLRADADDLPVFWACQKENWTGLQNPFSPRIAPTAFPVHCLSES
jgi:hypothetical protein